MGFFMATEEKQQTQDLAATPPLAESGRSRSRKWLVALAAFAIVAGVMLFGILTRVKARTALRAQTAEMAVPTVSVVHPQPSAPVQEIVLPANVQAITDSPIFARTTGYLKKWYVDIGAHVKKGQLLAVIETPEIDQQLRQARADLATAQANLKLAEVTANRFQDLLKSNSVSQQETDNAVASFAANRAIVNSNEANTQRLSDLKSFQKIYAPFDGIITARNTDIGALINSGSSGGPTTELFHIAYPRKLYVYVSVPQAYSQAAKPGLQTDLVLAEFPGRRFPGKLVRTANAIDPATRTLQVQIVVDNPDGTLLPGAYAEVHLKVPAETSTYTVPVNTLLFRFTGLHIATVQNGKVLIKTVEIGRDFGDRVEIVSGLEGNDSVILNPPDSTANGQAVRIGESLKAGISP
jgi:RND family efflux transporter MFP subunit